MTDYQRGCRDGLLLAAREALKAGDDLTEAIDRVEGNPLAKRYKDRADIIAVARLRAAAFISLSLRLVEMAEEEDVRDPTGSE